MSKTADNKKSNNHLSIISKSIPDLNNGERATLVLANDSEDLEVFILTKNSLKAKHQNRIANLLMKLWNSYDALPSKFKYDPGTLFHCAVNSIKLIDSREKEVDVLTAELEAKQEEMDSLVWWSKVYRFGYLLIILGLIVFALIK